MGSENRQKGELISVRVTPEERERIAVLAKQCSLPMSTYLRQLGLGYVPRSTVDQNAIREVAELGADLGRVGGLLKLWLADNRRVGLARSLDVPKLLDEVRALKRKIAVRIAAL